MNTTTAKLSKYALPDIEDETDLKPRTNAVAIVREAADYLSRFRLEVPEEEATTAWLVERANHLYRQNATFRLKLKAEDGGDHLSICMRKWLTARWKKTNPELVPRLPERFTGDYGMRW